LESLLDTQLELAQNSEGGVAWDGDALHQVLGEEKPGQVHGMGFAWEGDALHQVLGEEKPGQVHGMGLLPAPKQVYDRTTQHFKDINIVLIDGSSSDIDTHMLEEIRQLKEHSRMQDKFIAKLKNNQMHHENQEAIMVIMYILICNSILKCVTQTLYIF
jgi:hypothetical protein